MTFQAVGRRGDAVDGEPPHWLSKLLVVAMAGAFCVVNALVLLELTLTNCEAPKPLLVNLIDLVSDESVAMTPVESVNWLMLAIIAELFVELTNDNCTEPTLPVTEIVTPPLVPVLEPRKFRAPT